jgi:hypothetical protein
MQPLLLLHPSLQQHGGWVRIKRLLLLLLLLLQAWQGRQECCGPGGSGHDAEGAE